MSGKYYESVPAKSVEIRDAFWGPKMEVNRTVTIPTEFEHCRNTGRIDAFKLNWKPGDQPVPHIFWDSDVAKWIEAASYSLVSHYDGQLDSLLDEVIGFIASSQQPDGYLNSHYTAVEPEKRWTNLRDCHELYCAGHMMEAGVAHYYATGKTSLLHVVCRYADYIGQVFGTGEGQKRGYCGHEEIELALVKLYHATGNRKYLELSSYFIEERGREPNYFVVEAIQRKDDQSAHPVQELSYFQAHMPVRQQERVTGHAVRAMYLYSAMADLARELDDESLERSCARLWNHLCAKQMYVTGGIGASCHNEGFLGDYDLPNETAYCETCAAIGFVFWTHRMLKQKCDGKYADMLERVLYNTVLSGCSIDGKSFFYANPLAAYKNTDPQKPNGVGSAEYYRRSEWFGCACCPPNYARLMASLGEYIYTFNEEELAIHLYLGCTARLQMKGANLSISQNTAYPWDGNIHCSVTAEKPVDFCLKLRIPGWCNDFELYVNQERCGGQVDFSNGYMALQRLWNSGDQVLLKLGMPVSKVYSHPDIRYNTGCMALERGPLVYCLEQADHTVPLHRIVLSDSEKLFAKFKPDLLNGAAVITGRALAAKTDDWGDKLYRPEKPVYETCNVTAIPYFLWNNREPGAMRVWIPFI